MKIYLYQLLWRTNWLQYSNNKLIKILKEKIYRKLHKIGLVESAPFTTKFFGMNYSGDLQNLIDRHVYRYGGFEKFILTLIKDILTSYTAPTFLDIGSNIGQHSLYASQYAGHLHAFEPFLPLHDSFRKNIADNKLENIRIHPVGLGNQHEIKQFFMPANSNKGTGSFLHEFNDTNQPGPCLTIVKGDDYLREQAITSFELMKIDVEGFEKYVLQGLQETLLAVRPIVILEITKNLGSSFQDKHELNQVFPPDYLFYSITKKSPDRQDDEYRLIALNWNQIDYQADILAVPVEKMKILRQII